MQNVARQIASKTIFYAIREIKRIKMNLNAGANIQIVAPRRVGTF
jgi:hypothetical protein